MSRPLFVGYETWKDLGGEPRRGSRFELDGDALVTHGFVCGSTGTGKTVFSKSIVEEVLLSGVPVIAVDLKGDLVSMALHQGWLGPGPMRAVFGEDAERREVEYREGLAGHPAVASIARAYAERVECRLFSPKAPIARRVAMSALPSYGCPAEDESDRVSRRELTHAIVRGLGARMWGSRSLKRRAPELTFIEELVGWASEQGRSLEGIAGLQELGRLVAAPPIAHVGGMPIDEYLDDRARTRLRQKLAAECAGASQDWYAGEPLDVETLIGGAGGKVPLAILYLGHLASFEDQALCIANVCGALYRWMRRQGGASGLRLMLYIDEVGGASGPTSFFPSNPYQPPSKAPLGLLVRQGRAHGLGVLLATQNPMSVDVQALANIGTWAIGRLTQKNELNRVASVFEGSRIGPRSVRAAVAACAPHTFLVKTPRSQTPTWVEERWLSTVHTVLTREQVMVANDPRRARAVSPRQVGVDAASVDDADTSVGEEWGGVVDRVASERRSDADRAADAERAVHADHGDGETPGWTAPTGRVDAEVTAATRFVEDEDRGRWVLLIGGTSRVLQDGDSFLIGRSRRCDIILADEYVSGKNLRVRVEQERLVLTPLRVDRNPPKLGGEDMTGPVEVDGGHVEVVVGRTELFFSWHR